MRLINPYILWTYGGPVQVIEQAGRTCYKSEAKMTGSSHADFIRKLIERGHEAVLEHVACTYRIVCDRGVTHELVRHRLAAYCQESTRYCDYADGHVEFIKPDWMNLECGVYTVVQLNDYTGVEHAWLKTMLTAELSYKDMRRLDQSPQQARGVLPNALKTEIVVTANLREWRHILKLRASKQAHPQMQQVMKELLSDIKLRYPEVFFDY